jgi:hypothetical protein
MTCKQWLHIDAKGMLPALPRMLEWLDYFAECGFAGLVWEYDDRYPWKTWPGTHRPGYSREGWTQILDHCRHLKLEMIPLIQTFAHLEWLLKHPAYAPMRERPGDFADICPEHPDTLPKLRQWIDEVIELHGDSKFIHLGADETAGLASCPTCLARASQAEHGKFSVYLRHISRMCEYVISKGRRPMIWADMFLEGQCPHLAAALPVGTILVDWQYFGPGPFASTQELRKAGCEVWGASAIRCAYNIQYSLPALAPRAENVLGWHDQAAADHLPGLIHTNWERSNSLTPIYGPAEGWLPLFQLAGNPAGWQGNPLRQPMELVSRIFTTDDDHASALILRAIEAIKDVRAENPFQQRAIQWWQLALRHRRLVVQAGLETIGYTTWRASYERLGLNPSLIQRSRANKQNILRELGQWKQDVLRFFDEAMLDIADANEFVRSRADNLEYFFQFDWAEGIDFSKLPQAKPG